MSSSSRSKNFRRRSEEDEDSTTNNDDSQALPPPKPRENTTNTKLKKPPPPKQKPQQHNHQAPKLLSFADDDNDEESITPRIQSRDRSHSSRAGRSSLSSSSSHHKITPAKDRLLVSSSSPSTPSNVQPQAGEYTKEKLQLLQKNTRSLAASSKPAASEAKPAVSAAEPVIVLKGLLKPSKDETAIRKITEEDQEDDEEEDEVVVDRRRKGSIERDGAESRFAAMGIGKSARDSALGSAFPDQATINLIRAKRERLRQSRAAPDYISLDAGSGLPGESDDEGDFQGRVALVGDKKDGASKGVFESIDGRAVEAEVRVDGGFGGEDDDEDAVEKIWEEEQFRKGLGKRVDNSTSLVSNGIAVPAAVPAVQQPSFPYPGSHQSVSSGAPLASSAAGIIGVSRSAEVMSISQQADVATRALKESVSRLKETHGRTMSSMIANDENLSASLLNITALEKSLSAAGEKFIFMQKLRDFVSVICDFLQHKAPYIEELEEEMQKLHEERASVILERRAADGADEMMEVDPAVRAAMSVFSKGGGASAIAAAATAAQAAFAAAREKSNLPVQLDEFGRDVNQQKRLDSVRRAEARKRRKARAEAKRMSSIGDSSSFHIEGESSTDESDSETTAYKSSRYELLQTAEQVFSDAADEFSKLSAVKEMFETWKRDYFSSYRDAYMSLSVPAIFSPYVRLELLKWDPLYEDRDFNDMQWHSLLFDYGLPKNRAEFDPDDADADLIPQLVEKVALPVLHHEIAHCWDLLSTRVTRNAVSAMSLVVTYVPASSEALQELLATIHSRLADAVSNLIVPNWGINIIKAVPSAARIAAYRFGLSIRLLKNICLWKDILALHILEKLALDELLSGKVLPHIRSVTPNIHDAITRTERIIASLSGVWSGGNVTAERSLKLQPLVECVMALGKALEEKHSSGASNWDETVGLARRLKRMLVDLNEYDKARAILRTFQLKEAL
eukprot:TRINITY_DN20554_c0_g2_i1.p1 TRINITY_DN20554_c0_g2~~TRINITY_DN20554_c0_g2_i1.p1  ORF type:complete len:962 (-),score=250.21 TRINITY_DN20554_c0_g2_i1:159-3044(-)